MNISVLIKRYPVLTYYTLAFTISWGGDLIVFGPSGIPGTTNQIEILFPIALMILLAGPILSGILSTGLVHGKTGFRELLTRLIKWRVGAHWFAVALLFTPLLVTVILLVLSIFSTEFLPDMFTTNDKASLLLTGIMVGLMGGFLEEIGWTGFAIPELRRRYSVFATGLIVGLLWGVWHFLVTFWASGDSSGALSLPLLLPPLFFYIVVLPLFRVFMVWVYDHTNSLLIAMLMHASLIVSTLYVLKPQATDEALIIYYLILSAVLGIIVAIVTVAKGRKLSRQPIGLKDDVT